MKASRQHFNSLTARVNTHHLLIVAEPDTRPSVCVVRLDVELHIVALASCLPADEVLAVVFLHRAVTWRLPVSMAIVGQLMWGRDGLHWSVLVEEVDLSVAALELVSVVLELVGLVELWIA
jgi:hypothetical protein